MTQLFFIFLIIIIVDLIGLFTIFKLIINPLKKSEDKWFKWYMLEEEKVAKLNIENKLLRKKGLYKPSKKKKV